MTGLNLTPIGKEETTQDKAYHHIKKAILNGGISNEATFTEVELTKMLQISRTPIRAAVQDLVKEGLLVPIPQKGLAIRQITLEEQKEIFVLRSSIEVEVLKKLSKEMTSLKLDKLKKVIRKQEGAMVEEDSVRFIDLDQEFHLTLSRLANYRIIEQVLYNLHNLTQLMGLKAVSKGGRMPEVISEHNKILEALQNQDSDLTSSLILNHLEKTRETLEVVDASD